MSAIADQDTARSLVKWWCKAGTMEEFAKNISRYNFANYLIPGSLYVLVLADRVPALAGTVENPLYFLLIAYFAGAVISRVGSTIVRPALFQVQRLRFDQYTYQDYIAADLADERIATLMVDRNLYRSIIALVLISYLSLRYFDLRVAYPWLTHYELEALAVFFMLLFVIAYLRQDSFITKRVMAHKAKKDENAD